jgi:hypothetical protein
MPCLDCPALVILPPVRRYARAGRSCTSLAWAGSKRFVWTGFSMQGTKKGSAKRCPISVTKTLNLLLFLRGLLLGHFGFRDFFLRGLLFGNFFLRSWHDVILQRNIKGYIKILDSNQYPVNVFCGFKSYNPILLSAFSAE